MSFNRNLTGDGIARTRVRATVGTVFMIGKQQVKFFIAADFFAAHQGDHASYYDIKAKPDFPISKLMGATYLLRVENLAIERPYS